MVIACRSVGEGLAALSAPDQTLLLVLKVVVKEFVDLIEILTIWYTPEHKLLWEGTMIRLGILSVGRFHLLLRPMTVGSLNVFELSREFVVIHSLLDLFLFDINDWLRSLLIPAFVEIPVFGNVIQVFELATDVLFLLSWDRDAVGFTRTCGFEIARRGWSHCRV